MMKKTALIVLFVLTGIISNSQAPGDSLAILYRHVYLYDNPDQLGSRVDKKGVSYLNKEKLYFLEIDSRYPSYYKVITSSADTAYVKSELVSFDQSLKHATIQEEVRAGKRKQDINDIFDANDYLPTWAIFLILAFTFYLIYLYIRFYRRFDFWYIRISGSKTRPVKHPWFILLPLIFGFILGSVQLFSSQEAQWYFMDGWQVYGSYPNFWGWLMWSCTVAAILTLFASLVISFVRFSIPFAIIYSLILTLSISFIFLFGAFTGGFAVLIFVAYAYFKYGRGGSAGNDSSSNGEYTRIDGKLFKKTGPTTWEKAY